MLRFSGAGVSDVGLMRDHNEDSAFVAPYVALVADGVGGAAAGEVASATAAYVVSAYALAHPDEDPWTMLAAAASAARDSLRTGAETDPERAGMATTLSVLATDGSRVALAHIGDSRAYRCRAGELERLSTDHTWVQKLLDEGTVEVEAVAAHPWRNVVLRSLHGDVVAEEPEVDLHDLRTAVGDRFLLCSDGLTDLVDDATIASVLATIADPHSAAARLVALANDAGGKDNVTSVVLDVIDGPRVCGDGMVLGALREITNVVDAGAIPS